MTVLLLYSVNIEHTSTYVMMIPLMYVVDILNTLI